MSRDSSTFRLMVEPGTLSICRPNAMFCATVMCGNRAYDWKTVFTRRRQTGTSSMRCPRRVIWPASGDSSPAMQRSRVVFPHPDGPSSTMNEPSAMSRLTESSASTCPPSGVWKVFVTSRTLSAGAEASKGSSERVDGRQCVPETNDVR